MPVLPAGGGDGSPGDFADRVQHMIMHHSSRWVDVPGRRVDHDRHGAAPDADAPVDEQRQRVFDATMAVEQLGARKVTIEVTHRGRPFDWGSTAQSLPTTWPPRPELLLGGAKLARNDMSRLRL